MSDLIKLISIIFTCACLSINLRFHIYHSLSHTSLAYKDQDGPIQFVESGKFC
jgi:hypothetical protein